MNIKTRLRYLSLFYFCSLIIFFISWLFSYYYKNLIVEYSFYVWLAGVISWFICACSFVMIFLYVGRLSVKYHKNKIIWQACLFIIPVIGPVIIPELLINKIIDKWGDIE